MPVPPASPADGCDDYPAGFSLEPKRLQLVQQRQTKDPFLFLLEARRGGNPGIRLLPTLFLQDDQGEDTPAFRRILGDYRQNGREKEETI